MLEPGMLCMYVSIFAYMKFDIYGTYKKTLVELRVFLFSCYLQRPPNLIGSMSLFNPSPHLLKSKKRTPERKSEFEYVINHLRSGRASKMLTAGFEGQMQLFKNVKSNLLCGRKYS